MYFTPAHPAIRSALQDLHKLLAPDAVHVERVELFGSTLSVRVAEARDIDFFVAFRDVGFSDFRDRLLQRNVGRHVVVESHEASYSNCPSWDAHEPLTLHLILYRQDTSQFSAKLLRTRQAALDVTTNVLG